MTTINLMTSDQHLIAAQKVKIAAGDINSVLLHVEFDAAWDEFTDRKAVFANDSVNGGEPQDILFVGNECTAPHEQLSKDGILSISVTGYTPDGTTKKTSTIVKIKVFESLRDSTTTIAPTMDLYMQYLAALKDTLNPVTENVAATLQAQTESVTAMIEEFENILEGDILWENPDMTAELEAQTISVNTEGYKRFVATYSYQPTSSVENAAYCTPVFFVRGIMPYYGSTRGVFKREVKVKDGVINIYNAQTADNETANSYIIIGKIIGYKY